VRSEFIECGFINPENGFTVSFVFVLGDECAPFKLCRSNPPAGSQDCGSGKPAGALSGALASDFSIIASQSVHAESTRQPKPALDKAPVL
jgi:hypothetical protein